MKKLKGKSALITGAADGLGRALAIEFAKAGSDLVLVDLDEEALNRVKDEVEKMSARTLTFVVDVSNKEKMEDMAKEVINNHGGLDVLVNNAGVGCDGEAKDLSLDDWRWIIDVNLFGAIHGIHFFLNHMIEKGGGHIVNVSSGVGLMAWPAISSYVTTKSAIVGLSESLRIELSRYDIGVTVVCPGFMKTKIVESGRSRLNESAAKWFQDFVAAHGVGPGPVAKKTLRAVRSNKYMVRTPAQVVIGDLFHRAFPNIYRAAAAGVYKITR